MEKKYLVKVLKIARDLLARPGGWTKGDLVKLAPGYEWRSQEDRQVFSRYNLSTNDGVEYDPEGLKFCLIGGIRFAQRNLPKSMPYKERFDIERKASQLIVDCVSYGENRKFFDVVSFNDNGKTRQKDVIKALDCAIEKAESEGDRVLLVSSCDRYMGVTAHCDSSVRHTKEGTWQKEGRYLSHNCDALKMA